MEKEKRGQAVKGGGIEAISENNESAAVWARRGLRFIIFCSSHTGNGSKAIFIHRGKNSQNGPYF